MSKASTPEEPDLLIGPLSIWVHGYQFATADNDWDANWLLATARCDADGATVRATGSFLTTTDLERFAKGCTDLYRRLEGSVALDPIEPYLHLAVRYTDRAGHLEGRAQITPDHMSQRHEFVFELDQSYLPEISAACHRILERLPIRQVEDARGA